MRAPASSGTQVAQPAQQVVELVRGLRLPLLDERLEAELEIRERRGVEQLAQLLLAEQLAEEVAVQRQRLGPALGHGGVALVHVGGDVVEQQAARERGRPRRLDRVDGQLPPLHAAQDLAQGRQVEHVGQALPVGLHQDREGAIPARDREQVRRPLALLPQRRPGAGPAPGQEQGAGRVLAEPAREQARPADAPHDQVLDLVGVREQQLLHAVEARVALGQPDRDAVVGVDRLDLEAEALLEPRLDRERPRGVHAATERREHDEPPVAQLVSEPLDHDPAVGREGAGCLALVLEVGEEVVGGEVVEVVVAPQAPGGPRPALRALREVGLDAADELADGPAQLHGPADRVAVPERQLARHARSRRHRHPVGRDLRDPPGAGAQDHDVAVHPGAQLVDHLLVELPHPAAGRPRLALEEHRVQPPVRDRAAAGDGDDARVAPALDDVGHAVPRDARLELRELVRRVGAGEHAQDALEDLARQRLERRRAADDRQQLVHGEALADGHRHQLLGEDVERVARQDGRLDPPVAHAPDDDRRLQEVAAVLGEDHALAGLAHVVAGTADALEAAGDRCRALDLDHEVDGAHVDAELQAAGRDEGREASGLELLLDLEALLPRDAAVVGPDELLAGELVEALGQALGEAAAVGEHDGAVVRPDQLQDPGVDRGPDAGPHLAAQDRAARLLVHGQDLAQAGHVLDGDDDLELEGLAGAGVDDGDLAALARAAEVAGDGLERSLGGGQADALERADRLSRRARSRRRRSGRRPWRSRPGCAGPPGAPG